MLPPVDRKSFFPALAKALGVRSWTEQQVEGLDRLLDGFEADHLIPEGRVGVQRAAYYVYTDWHETGHTFTPVKERGGPAYYVKMYGAHTARGKRLGNDTDQEAIDYAGAGDVQLTGENNFEAAEDLIRRNYPELVARFEAETGRTFDLTVGDQPNDRDDPKNALVPYISYAIMVGGTSEGLFGPPISRFINPGGCDYYNARRSVNVLDHADRWRDVCPKIEKALREAIDTAADAPQTAALDSPAPVGTQAGESPAGTTEIAAEVASSTPPAALPPAAGTGALAAGAGSPTTVEVPRVTSPLSARISALVTGTGVVGITYASIFDRVAGYFNWQVVVTALVVLGVLGALYLIRTIVLDLKRLDGAQSKDKETVR